MHPSLHLAERVRIALRARINKVYQDGPSEELHLDVKPKEVMPTENPSSKSVGVVLSAHRAQQGQSKCWCFMHSLFSVKN